MSAKRDLPRNYELTIDRLSHEGRGVGRYEGKTVFVADALPGEQVAVKVTRRHRRFDEAVATAVLKPDPARVTPRCAHAAQCGGCSLQHLDSAAQIAHKQAVLLELLQHQAGVTPDNVLAPVVGPQWGYRRRARLSVRVVPKKGGVLIGFREKATHYVTDIDTCAVLIPSVGEILPVLRKVISALSVVAHIPQIEVASDGTTTILIIRHLAPLNDSDRQQLAAFESATGLAVYLQASSAVMLEPLTGVAPLGYCVDDLAFAFEPGDFIQVNAEINVALVALALDALQLDAGDSVLDLFCGLGNFTLPIAKRARHVVGVESDSGLLARAHANAERNAIRNVEFVATDLFADAGIAKLAARSFQKVLLDPPRTGAHQLLRTLDLNATSRVVYVSCNPVTLARDTSILVRERGFRLCTAGVIDMFPHTAHVESIAVFER